MYIVCRLLLTLIFIIPIISNAEHKNISIRAAQVFYDKELDSVRLIGPVYISHDDIKFNADFVYYEISNDRLLAEGNVSITDENGNVINGERAIFKDKLKKGIIKEFIIKFDKNIILASRLAKRVNNNIFELNKSVFTPCDIRCTNTPLWQIRSDHTNLDYSKEKITYRHMFFEIYGVPIIYFPYFTHPTPSAPAQSGMLTPELKNNDIMVPFYFRIKPNLDFTLSPRLSKNYTIIEAQYRHMVDSGEYKIEGSYGNIEFSKTDQNKNEKNYKPGRFHILSVGDFVHNNMYYGFSIERASDKAYLTNYQNIYDSYLTSKFYSHIIDNSNYFLVEGFYFQDLRDQSNDLRTPLILPTISTKNIVKLDNSMQLNIQTNSTIYKEPKGNQLFRTSFDIEFSRDLISNAGHVVKFALSNRSDIYASKFSDQETKEGAGKTLTRNIPEFKAKWRYPVIGHINNNANLKIEPTAMFVLGKKYEKRFDKFCFVDDSKNELSENNIFSSNKFTGIDFHDYGTRFSYGLNSSIMSEYFYSEAFLGQSLHKYNVTEKGSSEYVGNITSDISDNIQLFYRFRKDQMLKPIRNELGMTIYADKISAKSTYSELHNISRFFATEGFKTEKNKISQLTTDIDYRLTKQFSIGSSAKLDITSNSTKILVRSIRMTYLFDCVSIRASITDNFLQDSLRGVKKARTQSFAVGLKVINM